MAKLTLEEEQRILKELEEVDTPTVTNAVATYPGSETCLGLYPAWEGKWYTDQRMKTMFPELGSRCGYAVTCVYGLPDPESPPTGTLRDILKAMQESPKPVILLIKQDYPEPLRDKVGLCGGNMTTAFKAMGCTAILSDGPSRDLAEVRALGVQYMLTGVTAGHGPMAVKAVNVPVELCGMEVSPGEIVHLDINGAVKFPRENLEEVLSLSKEILADEKIKMSLMAGSSSPDEIAEYMKGNYR